MRNSPRFSKASSYRYGGVKKGLKEGSCPALVLNRYKASLLIVLLNDDGKTASLSLLPLLIHLLLSLQPRLVLLTTATAISPIRYSIASISIRCNGASNWPHCHKGHRALDLG